MRDTTYKTGPKATLPNSLFNWMRDFFLGLECSRCYLRVQFSKRILMVPPLSERGDIFPIEEFSSMNGTITIMSYPILEFHLKCYQNEANKWWLIGDGPEIVELPL